eukprot:scaffold109276_cov21-Tisochrysis_lutea.AAC.1
MSQHRCPGHTCNSNRGDHGSRMTATQVSAMTMALRIATEVPMATHTHIHTHKWPHHCVTMNTQVTPAAQMTTEQVSRAPRMTTTQRSPWRRASQRMWRHHR